MLNSSYLEEIRCSLPPVLTNSGREDVIAIISRFCCKGVGAEIGTFNGTFAGEMLRRTDISKLYCIDPYKSYENFNDAINEMDLEVILNAAKSFLSDQLHRAEFVRKFSDEACIEFSDESLDFVYIDGNHQSEFVYKDLQCWWPKLKKGGIMMGDDVADLSDENRNAAGDVELVHVWNDDGTPKIYGQYGVLHALRRFSKEHELDFHLTGSQFLLPKPKI